ncbi:TRAP transporter, DctQ-like membrane protein [Glaciecola punicea ACAM 611]|jgi:TRAP-type C4-dicarboxylate transport system permease small subunit|uniref:TRAP transporter small permease protein n=1 Tax=Glaciecola punicea ACAM 611 TaxID=1121923 RepID=H5TE82_9ALTE|nr:TRAP transporter small permease [Glaciecola punicea]GAB56609.1 TRAP transporter, DctQ-like membrane protein [Glaciecola punicea ACAM 611]
MSIVQVVDKISEVAGKLAAWLFVLIALSISYEVVVRYFFNRPTIWVDEVSTIAQVWATYLGAAYILKRRKLIVVELVFHDTMTLTRKISESFALLVIVCVCLIAVRYGYSEWLDKTLKGATSASFLATPKWATLSCIWIGFGLLCLQSIVELWRIWTVGIPDSEKSLGAH